ncbi:MAG: site-specific DNA-methyltransferase [Candidatus Bipolaricaulis sp.]|nr:site-specific DNA-methyltransferase [Candidatus Bipolaricaulis sp.]
MKPYYQDEWTTIYLGDCREILPQLEVFDLGVTSPPYNSKKQWWECGSNGMFKDMAHKFTRGGGWYPDEIPEDEYQAREKKLVAMALSKCSGSICYNHKVRYAFKRAGRSFHPIEWLPAEKLWCEIIWDRMSGVTFNSRRPVVSDERIFVLGRPKIYHNIGLNTVWRIVPDREAPEHPCAFPLAIPKRLIAMFTNPGDMVLDYYAGSGTTLVAAKQLNRKSIGIEIEEKYCELAVKRLSQSVMDLRMCDISGSSNQG